MTNIAIKSPRMMRDYAWKYFEMHAKQRLVTFQFYLTISSALTIGIASLVEKFPSSAPSVGTSGSNFINAHSCVSGIGFLLMIFSLVFWSLDRRTRQLIHNAENALEILDREEFSTEIGSPCELELFANEKVRYAAPSCCDWKLDLFKPSYSRTFCVVFLSFGVVGFFAALGEYVIIVYSNLIK